jgi:hypothetical protein
MQIQEDLSRRLAPAPTLLLVRAAPFRTTNMRVSVVVVEPSGRLVSVLLVVNSLVSELCSFWQSARVRTSARVSHLSSSARVSWDTHELIGIAAGTNNLVPTAAHVPLLLIWGADGCHKLRRGRCAPFLSHPQTLKQSVNNGLYAARDTLC